MNFVKSILLKSKLFVCSFSFCLLKKLVAILNNIGLICRFGELNNTSWVLGPAIPSTLSPLFLWNFFTASIVEYP